MLVKLLKHDMKAISRYLLPMHLFLLLTSIAGHFSVTLHAARFPRYAFPLMLIAYITVIMVVCMGTYLIITIRFYKNLFTDEGYLTWTLPATAGQHLLSKYISGAIWCFVDMIVILISVSLLLITPEVWNDRLQFITEFQTTFHMNLVTLIWILIIIYLIEILIAPICMYICVAVGQLFSSHHILGAVITYFLLATLSSIVLFASLMASGYMPLLFGTTQVSNAVFIDYLFFCTKFSIIFSGILGIASYIGTYYIMKKRLNLG